MPRICIFAIISAVNKHVTKRSQKNVIRCSGGNDSKVFGVFKQTQSKLRRAQALIKRRTQTWNRSIKIEIVTSVLVYLRNLVQSILIIEITTSNDLNWASYYTEKYQEMILWLKFTLLTHSISVLSLNVSSGP